VVYSVGTGPLATLGQVQGDGTGRAADLLGESAIPRSEPFHGTPQGPHQIETDLKSLEPVALSLLSLSAFTHA
jgi:hypothetical protein